MGENNGHQTQGDCFHHALDISQLRSDYGRHGRYVGELFNQMLNVEGRLALGVSEGLDALAYGKSGPSPATDPGMIK